MISKKDERWFTKKLRHVVGSRCKCQIDRAAGLPDGTVAVLLFRGTIPQPFYALKLARVLGVDVVWLIDEAQENVEPEFYPGHA